MPPASLTNDAIPNARARGTVIFHCQAGSRTQDNTVRLAAAAAPTQVSLLARGTQGWRAAESSAEEDRPQSLPLMRQVQTVAGVLILLGILLGYAVSNGFFLLGDAIDAGLTFAGVTGSYGMACLPAIMSQSRCHKG